MHLPLTGNKFRLHIGKLDLNILRTIFYIVLSYADQQKWYFWGGDNKLNAAKVLGHPGTMPGHISNRCPPLFAHVPAAFILGVHLHLGFLDCFINLDTFVQIRGL